MASANAKLERLLKETGNEVLLWFDDVRRRFSGPFCFVELLDQGLTSSKKRRVKKNPVFLFHRGERQRRRQRQRCCK
ncbi:hypothetical protein HanXRQr2_Chr02g0058911 [Helianthus annuus]|uniref:Uncharacterized protein n=1 Tax=Helianthus annuus TaxID=4232 RepID=A0A251VEJ1_HELAN|nr:hypothetical protein HanXRQr2_Chr02g0058911 [Helianthus annuus]KAJ0604330.1 hypothetical protein HanHA300_Chr02g0048521 [Helianthus annuus]KAJ0618360.1 hypothetical protein HanHA89_Chr02g0052301 [Helianthus annuus]KAJ0776811.1 hypothetical protein HanLR1_Chr02g0049921 [Helianthus annuus]